jgi:hypothetical protein
MVLISKKLINIRGSTERLNLDSMRPNFFSNKQAITSEHIDELYLMPQNLINKFNKQAITRPYETYATMQKSKSLACAGIQEGTGSIAFN